MCFADDIAEKMLFALSNQEFRAKLRAHGIAHAQTFSWENSARTALNALEKHFRPLGARRDVITSASDLEQRVLAELWKLPLQVEPDEDDLALLSGSAKRAAQILGGITLA